MLKNPPFKGKSDQLLVRRARQKMLNVVWRRLAMTASAATHPSEKTLLAFSLGRLPPEERDEIERHLESCQQCGQWLGAVGEEARDTLLDLAREAAATPIDQPARDTVFTVPAELADHPRYRLLSRHGEGGMGVVFKAEHKLMGRTVALKIISRRLTSNEQAVERFRREVRAAAKLSHPNIVTAHDAEEADGLHFLAMEFVDGISLDRFVAKQKGNVPVSMACHFVRQAALGLQHAHQQGMVHRDIKPQNLILTRKGHVKILDFGLARLGEDQPPDGASSPNLVVGTPDYLAPEQARDSHAVDIRADIYALGCTLYFLLARRVPYPGGSPFEKMVAHTDKPADSLTMFRDDVPLEVEAIVAKMMAKCAEDRYQTPAEVAAALAPFAKLTANSGTETMPTLRLLSSPFGDEMTGATVSNHKKQTQPVSPLKKRVKRPYGLIAAVAGFLLVGGLIAYFALRDGKPNDSGSNRDSGSDSRQASLKQQPKRTFPNGDGRPFAKDPAWDKSTYHVLIAVPNYGLWVPDFEPVRRYLIDRGVHVTVAGPVGGAVTPLQREGNNVPPNWSLVPKLAFIDDFDVLAFDAIITVGANVDSYNPKFTGKKDWAKEMKLDPGLAVGEKLRQMKDDGKIIGAICTGQAVLIWHDILKDNMRAAHITTDLFYNLENNYPKIRWEQDPIVVREGNIITASGPAQATRFADEIYRALQENRK